MVHVFHEIGNKEEVLHEFSRLLKVSGRLAIVEKTRAEDFFSRRFGPPVIDYDDAVNSLTQGGFRVNEVVQNREDSVIIASKM